MKTIRVGIIGYGKRGHSHYSAIQRVNHARIVAISDVTLKTQLARKVNAYRNYRDLLAKESPDAVIICTPTNSHFSIAKTCLKAGVNVFVEKPLTKTIAQAKQLVKICQQQKLVCFAGYHLQYDPMIVQLMKLVRSNQIGRILMVRCRQAHNWDGGKPFSWHLSPSISGGGTLTDNATHYIELLQSLIGPIRTVSAITNNLAFHSRVEDSAFLTLKHNNKVISSIESSWADASGRNNQVTVWGVKGVIEYLENNTQKTVAITHYEKHDREWNKMRKDFLYIPKGIERNLSKRPNSSISEDGLANILNAFFAVINRNAAARKSVVNHLLQTIQVVNAAYKSQRTNKQIRIS